MKFTVLVHQTSSGRNPDFGEIFNPRLESYPKCKDEEQCLVLMAVHSWDLCLQLVITTYNPENQNIMERCHGTPKWRVGSDDFPFQWAGS